MNYAVYTYRVVDGQTVCEIVAYTLVDADGRTVPVLMDQSQAEAYAATITDPSITKMVLPLLADRTITAA